MANNEPTVVFRTDYFSVITINENTSGMETTTVKLLTSEQEIDIGEYFSRTTPDVREFYQCNDNAIAILGRNALEPEKNPWIKVLFYIPTLSFVNGSQEQLKMIYHMLFDVNEEQRIIDLDEKTVVKKLVRE